MSEQGFKDIVYEGDNNQLVFFLHGIFMSPKQFNTFYPILEDLGYSYYAPILKGHGSRIGDVAKVKYHEWITQVNQLLEELSKMYTKIYNSICRNSWSRFPNEPVISYIKTPFQGSIRIQCY